MKPSHQVLDSCRRISTSPVKEQRHIHQSSTKIISVTNYDHLVDVMIARLRREAHEHGIEDFSGDELRLRAAAMAAGRVEDISFYRARRALLDKSNDAPDGYAWVMENRGRGWQTFLVHVN